METFKLFMIRRDVMTMCAMLFLSGLVALGFHYDLNKSEWASWVQAIGSIATIAGALWVFYKQVENERTNSRAVAKLASSRIYPRLDDLADEYQGLVEELTKIAMIDGDPARINVIYQLVKKPPDWTIDELSKLAPLPKHGALRLAKGLGGLTTMRLHMRKFVSAKEFAGSPEYRRRLAGEAATILAGAVEHLRAAAKIMLSETQ